MPSNQFDKLLSFFHRIWGETEGYVYTPIYFPPYGTGNWKKYMFQWPRQDKGVVKHVLKHTAMEGVEVFFAPAIFRTPDPEKDNVLGTWVLWADFDGNAPDDYEGKDVPEPSIRIQSSKPGHEHVYWMLKDFINDIDVIDDRNRAIAYFLKADTSGWDADQVLRPPYTMNNKRGVPVRVKRVAR